MNKSGAIFWDSSALVKWYIEEDGSAEVRNWFQKTQLHHAAALSHAEVLATFSRLKRENLINKKENEECVTRFLNDFRKLLVIDYTMPVRRMTETVAAQVALRGADLVQLVSALTLRQKGMVVALATFDEVLANAARDQDLEVL